MTTNLSTKCRCGCPLAAGHTFCSTTCEREAAANVGGYTVRQAHSTGNAHLATDAALLCGSPIARTSRVRPVDAEKYVTCSKCRRIVGWATIPGSYAARTTAGLDSSAWGANMGR